MDCKNAVKLINPYLENKLSGAQLEEFLEHLKDCEHCHAETETWYMITQTLENFQNESHIAYDMRGLLDQKIDGQIHHIHMRKRYEKMMLIILGVGLLILVFLLIQYFGVLSMDFLKGWL